ncbi:MAG TPA: A/G-specific adenine glycosylase [Firmicutes bacterium]|nr:A/G-specific adenine glycosylase [Bacillota bacterium]
MKDLQQGIGEKLLDWYDRNARVLPWRQVTSPYRTWVSEVMLQQTRVEAVLPYFARFIQEVPDPKALANLPEARLMKLWEGLGYYSRARNLQKAACVMTEKYGGQLPDSYEALLDLPGFGEYTAGAVASIAFGIPVPAVDGNVLRVFARILNHHGDILQGKVKKEIRTAVEHVLPAQRPGDFNQALMDLGAGVCLPGRPCCEKCPITEFCLGYSLGTAEHLPCRQTKKQRRMEEKTIIFLEHEGRFLFRRRPEEGLLAGMWEPPHLEGYLSESAVAAFLEEKGVAVREILALPDAKHIFTHIEWRMRGFLVRVSDLPQESTASKEGFQWADPAQREDLAVPSAFSRLLAQAEDACGQIRLQDLAMPYKKGSFAAISKKTLAKSGKI